MRECLCTKQCKIQICVSEVVGDRFCQPLSDKQHTQKKKRKKKKGVEDDEEKTQLRHLQCNDVGVSPTYITAPFVSSPSNIDTLQKITSEKQQQQQQQQQNPACVLLDYISASFAFISVSMLLKVVKWNVSMVEIIIVGISFCFICNVHDFFVFVGFLSF